MFDYINNGQGPLPLGSQQGGGLVPWPIETYCTSVLDLTQAQLDIEMIPARLGFFPQIMQSFWIIERVAGTQVTPLVCKIGSNATHDNLQASGSAPANVDVNSASPPSIANPISAAINTARSANATAYLDITSGAQGTGGFTLLGRRACFVQWISFTP